MAEPRRLPPGKENALSVGVVKMEKRKEGYEYSTGFRQLEANPERGVDVTKEGKKKNIGLRGVGGVQAGGGNWQSKSMGFLSEKSFGGKKESPQQKNPGVFFRVGRQGV